MYTTVTEDGLLNNYARELPTYYAQYPTVWEQQRYALLGAAATLFVGLLLMRSLAVS